MRLAARWRATGSALSTRSPSNASRTRICSVKNRTAVLGAPQVRSKMSNRCGRQAFVQGRTDVHPVALQAIGQGAVALKNRGGDPTSFKALREREAADAAADDEDME